MNKVSSYFHKFSTALLTTQVVGAIKKTIKNVSLSCVLMAPVHKIKGRNTSRYPRAVELMKDLTGRLSDVAPAPTEGRNRKQCECPLCVEVFDEFSQLRWHLLSMHPRRDMIMELVTERYGMSESRVERPTSPTLDSQHARELSQCGKQRAGKLQPGVKRKGTTAEIFQVPHKARHKPAAASLSKSNQCKSSCKEFASWQKVSPSEESSSWKSYLSFCLDDCITSEPLHGNY